MRLIGLAGPAGSGKDTIADYLVETYDYDKMSFAAPIKDALCAMFNWDPSKLNDREWKEAVLPDIGKSPRQLMQTLGTEWGRNLVNPHLWLIIAKGEIEYAQHHDFDIVVSDVRFENEAKMIREMGGVIWHIERDPKAAKMAHASEAGVERTLDDVLFLNTGTIEAAYGIADFIIEAFPTC